jgi:tetratricopeptide (TPR) repeat protein
VVAWIPCRNESLLAIWSIACTLLLVAFLRTGRRSALAFSLVCLVGVVFTKESGAGLLAVLACVVVLEATGRPGERRDLLWAAAGALVVTGGWAALRRVALGAFPVNASFVLENLSVLVVYLGKTLFPVGLAAIPHPEDTSLLPGLAALGVLGLAIAHTGRRLYGVAGLGLVWYAAFLLPTLLVPRQTWGLEHRIYVPLLGMLLFAARLRPPAWLPASATLGPALALGVALLFGIVTARRLPDFAGPIPYWESAARSAPHSELAATGLAWRYYEAEELNAAIEAASTALALNPEEPAMYYLRAIVYRQRGFFDRAEADLRLALDLDPDNVGAWTNLASLQRRMGRREESRRSQRRAEQLRERHSADRED